MVTRHVNENGYLCAHCPFSLKRLIMRGLHWLCSQKDNRPAWPKLARFGAQSAVHESRGYYKPWPMLTN